MSERERKMLISACTVADVWENMRGGEIAHNQKDTAQLTLLENNSQFNNTIFDVKVEGWRGSSTL